MTDQTLTQADLAQFTGSETFYRHALMRSVVYTEGVKHVADAGGAHWLIDKIATLQLEPSVRHEEFQTWKLVRDATGDGAMLVMDDGNGNVVYRERIDYTDFPLPSIELWFTNNTILLPSEY